MMGLNYFDSNYKYTDKYGLLYNTANIKNQKVFAVYKI